MYFVKRSTLGMVQWMYGFARESLFCASVNLFLGEYLGTPLGGPVCCLVVEVSVVLYFQYVLFRIYGFAWCHVFVFSVCRSPSFGDASPVLVWVVIVS